MKKHILCQFGVFVATLKTAFFLLNRGSQSRESKERECEEGNVAEFHNEWDGINVDDVCERENLLK